jgi:hypothetical protein
MDQAKEYLKLAIKYRFWILVGIAALLPMIAFFVATGPIEAEEKTKSDAIKSAYEEVNKFASNSNPINKEYPPLVEQKTEVLKKDVNVSWRKLYDRQAPLLTWPESVAETIPVWGRKWPEGTAPEVVRGEIFKYIETYDPYVDEVFKTFHPFDYETGDGIVASAPKEALLRPAQFSDTKPPSLGKVWDAQQRLWVQRTVLDVVAKVNDRADAKDWLTAPIKEILSLEVANPAAQDQKSIAKGEEIAATEDVVEPGTEQPEEAAAGTEAPGGKFGGEQQQQMMMMGGTGSMGMGMGMGAGSAPQEFMILPSPNPNQAFIVPIYVSVYVEQDRIPDFLVEFQNSPMNIEVLDFAMFKPAPHSVKKPKKGDQPSGGFGMMGGYPGMGRGMMGEMMMGGYGGMMPGGGSMMGYGPGGGMGMGAEYGSTRGMSGGYQTGYGMGMPGGEMGGVSTPKKSGVDVRAETKSRIEAEKKKKEQAEKEKDTPKPEIIDTSGPDPYYNVVKLDIYGRARFYLPPPKEEESQSEADATAEPPADAAEAQPAEGAGEPAKAEGTGEQPKAEGEPAKTEAAPGPDGEQPKAEGEAKPAAEAKPAEAEAKPEGSEPATPETKPAQPEGEQPKGEAPAPAPGSQPGARN